MTRLDHEFERLCRRLFGMTVSVPVVSSTGEMCAMTSDGTQCLHLNRLYPVRGETAHYSLVATEDTDEPIYNCQAWYRRGTSESCGSYSTLSERVPDELVSALLSAVPCPLERLWRVMDRNRLMELVVLWGRPGVPQFHNFCRDDWASRSVGQHLLLADGNPSIRAFWALVDQGVLRPASEYLRGSEVRFGRVIGGESDEVGYSIDGYLLMHPEAWVAGRCGLMDVEESDFGGMLVR